MMKTCPKCGGENLAGASICRLCAIALPALEEPPAKVKAENSLPAPAFGPVAATDSRHDGNIQASCEGTKGATCPVCLAINDCDWPFCERCGGRLPGSEKAIDPQSLREAVRSATPASGSFGIRESQVKSADPQSAGYQSPPQATTSEAGAVTDPNGFHVRAGAPRDGNDVTAMTVDTGKHPVARESARNMGLSTTGICDSCGFIQPGGGLFCAGCGARLSAAAIAQATDHDSAGHARLRGVLHLITDGGDVGETFDLDQPEVIIGRNEGDLKFPHDGFMSGRHARVVERGGRYFLVDDGSRNGTFIRIGKEVALEDGDTVLIGKQVLRFERG